MYIDSYIDSILIEKESMCATINRNFLLYPYGIGSIVLLSEITKTKLPAGHWRKREQRHYETCRFKSHSDECCESQYEYIYSTSKMIDGAERF